MNKLKSTYLPRTIGVLLHPTSLPTSPVCGTFGDPSRQWLNLLASNRIAVWQLLPLGPVDSMGSPYSSPSSFALNPWFLDAEDLFNEGYIASSAKKELSECVSHNSSILDFKVADHRAVLIGKFLCEAWPEQSPSRKKLFQKWLTQQNWLEDHVLFMELRKQNDGKPWWQWPIPFANHDLNALKSWKKKHSQALLGESLIQWHLDRQLQDLRRYARELGIIIFGDLPFYVSHDSSDVWAKRSLFSVLPNGKLELQSGVPPDYFSETGQLWGTPIYKWRRHHLTMFRWWRQRFSNQRRKFDLLRLDHFRALISFWCVSGKEQSAIDGTWQSSPGETILKLLKRDCGGKLPLIAEDLGEITPEVELLRDQFELPGMKILQFAFDGNEDNPYLPENIHGNNWVVYPGTHDNPTTMGWWNDLNSEERERISRRFKGLVESPSWELIDMALASEAKLVIATIQDLLCLDNNARFNTPGTIKNNWNWRLTSFDNVLTETLKGYGERGSLWGRSFDDGELFLY